MEQKLANPVKSEFKHIPINKWPQSERPREKLLKLGSEALSDSELIAILLRTGTGKNGGSASALDLAKSVLLCYENLCGLMDASVNELSEIKGIGLAKAAQLVAAIELGRRAVSQKNGSNTSFKCSEEVANYYIPLLKDLKNEQFRLVLLNVKNKIIKEVLVSQGSLTSSLVRLVTTQLFTGRAKSLVRLVKLFFIQTEKSMFYLN